MIYFILENRYLLQTLIITLHRYQRTCTGLRLCWRWYLCYRSSIALSFKISLKISNNPQNIDCFHAVSETFATDPKSYFTASASKQIAFCSRTILRSGCSLTDSRICPLYNVQVDQTVSKAY